MKLGHHLRQLKRVRWKDRGRESRGSSQILGVRHFKAGSTFAVTIYGLRILPHSFGAEAMGWRGKSIKCYTAFEETCATVHSRGFYLVAPTRWGKGTINSNLIWWNERGRRSLVATLSAEYSMLVLYAFPYWLKSTGNFKSTDWNMHSSLWNQLNLELSSIHRHSAALLSKHSSGISPRQHFSTDQESE